MSAVFSPCGNYRYLLARPGDPQSAGQEPAVFVMLNPSTADETHDDPTIARCRAFAAAWGYHGVVVANLYAWRSTDPRQLRRARDPIGQDNDRYLAQLARQYDKIICAWGNHAKPDRVRQALSVMQGNGARLWCLGVNKTGAPRHPLYVSADTRCRRWPPRVRK